MFFEFTMSRNDKKVLINMVNVNAFVELENGMRVVFKHDTNHDPSHVEVKDNYSTFMNNLKYSSMQQPQPFHRG